MAGDDAALQTWKRQFDATLYVGNPHLPPIATMREVRDKLAVVMNAVDSFGDEDETGQQTGLAVATMAIDFACKVLGQLGVFDGDEPTPKPLNLKMAKAGLLNLVKTIHQQISQHRIAMTSQADNDEIETADIDLATENSPARSKPVFKPESFSVEWRGKSLKLGNSLSYRLFEFLCQTPGPYIHIDTLIHHVWNGKDISDEAVQKQISNLRKKLADASFEGITFDGDQPKHYRLTLG